jgi:hypothetical protein
LELTQDKPVNRRRRWWTIAFVLLIVSSVVWWCWPRGDARFVGKWRLRSSSQGTEIRDATWTIRSNGSATLLALIEPDSHYVLHFRWRVDGDKLVLGWRPPSWANGPLQSLSSMLYQFSSGSYLFEEVTYDISFNSADEIVLKDVSDPGGEITLTRMPE